jgi:hypothetical protein
MQVFATRQVTRFIAQNHGSASLTFWRSVLVLSSQWVATCGMAFCLSLASVGGWQASSEDSVRMNQVIGSHHSYHAGIAASEVKLMKQRNPDRYNALEHSHKPLDEQLSSGIRQIALDVYADSNGGHFADPLEPKLVAQAWLPADPAFVPEGVMKKPGFKVMHVQDFDYRSTCQPFTACLETEHVEAIYLRRE